MVDTDLLKLIRVSECCQLLYEEARYYEPMWREMCFMFQVAEEVGTQPSLLTVCLLKYLCFTLHHLDDARIRTVNNDPPKLIQYCKD